MNLRRLLPLLLVIVLPGCQTIADGIMGRESDATKESREQMRQLQHSAVRRSTRAGASESNALSVAEAHQQIDQLYDAKSRDADK